jgi:hypothetical protein
MSGRFGPPRECASDFPEVTEKTIASLGGLLTCKQIRLSLDCLTGATAEGV